MNKKILIIIFAAALTFLFAQSSFAQTASLKIGYVGLNRVFDQYQKTGDYDKTLEQKSTQYKKDRNDPVFDNNGKMDKLESSSQA